MRREEQSMHPGQDEEKKGTPRCAREPGREEEGRESAPHACPPSIERGSAPFLAPPPFWKLPKKGRSSLPTASHRASTNRGASRPTPFLSHSSEKTGGKNPRTSRNSSGFLSRSTVFNAACCLRGGWSKITIGKKNTTSKDHSAVNMKNSL